jgi:hypothetical protein
MSLKLQHRKVKLTDTRRLITEKCVFQSIIQNQGELYKEAQNAANKSQFMELK